MPTFSAQRRDAHDPASTGTFALPPGNPLFEAAVAAVKLDGGPTRRILATTLRAIGVEAHELTPDDLGLVMPEIERRLKQLVRPEQAEPAMTRLRDLLLGWDAAS